MKERYFKIQIFDGDMTMTYHVAATDIWHAENKAIAMHRECGYSIVYLSSEQEEC